MRLAEAIVCRAGRVWNIQLVGDIGDDIGRDLRGLGQEGCQEPYCPQLDSEPQAVVVSTVLANQLTVPVVEVKVARQLEGRWRFGVASIAALLVLT